MPRPFVRAALIALALVPAFASCLVRPAASLDPTLKTNFTIDRTVGSIDKVDLLFVIDNSQSMGDKQRLLAQAVPDLVERLVSPYCVDASGTPVRSISNDIVHVDGGGNCTSGAAEFAPVVDMHIGIVSSSIGLPGVGGSDDFCAEKVGYNNNDHAHLIDRKADGTSVLEAGPHHFLSWFPPSERNAGKPAPLGTPITDSTKLSALFASMVQGTGEKGCGFEAQLESMYRFLIDPEPYESAATENRRTHFSGVDESILKQRAAFLRPDSLVAIIMLTDENESTFDPMQNGSTAWIIAQRANLYKPTDACAATPTDKNCASCGQDGVTAPECSSGEKNLSSADDPIALRFFEPKRRFGFDPRFDPQRYVDGLSLPTYKRGKDVCINPLFAATLPTGSDQDRCHLKRGPRSPELVFFAVIGGVPNDLLRDPNGKFLDDLTAAQMAMIVGRDPTNYDFTDVDPRMRESIEPRAGRPPPSSTDVDRDRVIPGANDLQFACTFELETPRVCNDPLCDCNLDPGSTLCDGKSQLRGKAYPTIREFEVVKKLIEQKSRGVQATVASLCPSEVKDKKSEEYGYRPAARTIVNRLARSLNSQCLPQPLTVTPVRQLDGTEIDAVNCLVLETLPEGRTTCDPALGLREPDPEVLKVFRRAQRETWNAASGLPDPDTVTVCELQQLRANVPCQTTHDGSNGWCYVSNPTSAGCPQALQLPKSLGNDVRVSLQCVQER